jgi:hypothetical protein
MRRSIFRDQTLAYRSQLPLVEIISKSVNECLLALKRRFRITEENRCFHRMDRTNIVGLCIKGKGVSPYAIARLIAHATSFPVTKKWASPPFGSTMYLLLSRL